MTRSDFDRNRLLELAEAHCLDQLDAEQLAELEEILHDNRAACAAFGNFVQMHVNLEECLEAEFAVGPILAVRAAPPSLSRRESFARRTVQFFARPTPFSMTVAAGVVGLLIAAMALMAPPVYDFIRGGDEPLPSASPSIVARLTHQHEAVWAEGQIGAQRGAFLQTGRRLTLTSGLAKITYDDGVEVLLEGPTAYVVTNLGAGTLERGRLTATVRKAARGFTITTPTATVVDLGTEFGVAVDRSGVTETTVFQGVVEVSLLAEGAGPVRVEAGQTVRTNDVATVLVDEQRNEVEDRYTRKLPARNTDHPPQTVGQVALVERLPIDAETGLIRPGPDAILYREAAGVALSKPMAVDLAASGVWGKGSTGTVPAGVKVDVYLVHFEAGERRSISGGIHFPRRIVGIIGGSGRLLDSEAQLGLRVPRESSEITAPFGLDDDNVELLRDGRSVRFELQAVKADQFRVLTLAAEPTQGGDPQQAGGPLEE